MAQVANLASERRLGQEVRRERLVNAEPRGYLAQVHHAAVVADEPGGVAPAAGAG